jgi:hypothetical protein
MKKDETPGASSMYKGRREMQTRFWRGKLKERGHLEDLRIDVRVMLEWFLKK